MADNTTLNGGTGGDVIASDDIGGVKFQRIKLIHGVDGTNSGDIASTNPLPVGQYFGTRSDTYTVTGNGTTVDVSAKPCKHFSLQVTGTGAAATAWNVILEGSLDGTIFTQILQHATSGNNPPFGARADGETITAQAGPFLYFRSRATATLTLGSATNVVATIVGMQ